jgi:hypothetical protein
MPDKFALLTPTLSVPHHWQTPNDNCAFVTTDIESRVLHPYPEFGGRERLG